MENRTQKRGWSIVDIITISIFQMDHVPDVHKDALDAVITSRDDESSEHPVAAKDAEKDIADDLKSLATVSVGAMSASLAAANKEFEELNNRATTLFSENAKEAKDFVELNAKKASEAAEGLLRGITGSFAGDAAAVEEQEKKAEEQQGEEKTGNENTIAEEVKPKQEQEEAGQDKPNDDEAGQEKPNDEQEKAVEEKPKEEEEAQ